MSVSNGIITKPLKMPDDLARVLGVGTDLELICKASSINKYARYKPLVVAKKENLTESDRASVNHGLSCPEVVTSSTVRNSTAVISACSKSWAYTKPYGTSASPYRLTDFAKPDSNSIGYYHDAVPPIQCVGSHNGWTFLKGTSQQLQFRMNFDLDPDDSVYNLQADDFMTGNIDLRDWKFLAYVDGLGGLWGESDYILDYAGELQGDTLTITLPTTSTGTYRLDVYVCMYRYNSGHYEFIPLPDDTYHNNFPATLQIIDDAQQSGGGIAGNTTQEQFQNVAFGYDTDSTHFKTAYVSTDNGTAEYSMKGDGSLYVMLNLTNTSGQTSTINRGDFELYIDGYRCVPSTMYNSSWSSVSSVNIANNSTVTIYLFFNDIFSQLGNDWTSSNQNNSWSMDFKRNYSTLFNCDFYCMRYQNASPATRGWVTR